MIASLLRWLGMHILIKGLIGLTHSVNLDNNGFTLLILPPGYMPNYYMRVIVYVTSDLSGS